MLCTFFRESNINKGFNAFVCIVYMHFVNLLCVCCLSSWLLIFFLPNFFEIQFLRSLLLYNCIFYIFLLSIMKFLQQNLMSQWEVCLKTKAEDSGIVISQPIVVLHKEPYIGCYIFVYLFMSYLQLHSGNFSVRTLKSTYGNLNSEES